MDNISDIVSKAYERYFSTLSKTGYVAYSEVSKLLYLTLTEELLTGYMSKYITEKDYNSIVNTIYCVLGNTCMANLPNYNTWDSLNHENKNINSLTYRVTEDTILRNRESNGLRIKA